MPRRIAVLTAAVLGLVVAVRRVQAERAEADLWREATDDPSGPPVPPPPSAPSSSTGTV